MHNLRHFLIELYRQMDEMYKRQKPDDNDSMILTVYRGQQMHRNELRNLIENIGQLSFINSFFSTTFKREVANTYAEAAANTTESVTVLFEIEINTLHKTRPYSHITNSGDEDEVIISPGTVVYLQSVEETNNRATTCNNVQSDNLKDELWLIRLKSIDEKHFLGETLTILSETNMIGAAQPVVICFFSVL
jgi:hypothetical protein